MMMIRWVELVGLCVPAQFRGNVLRGARGCKKSQGEN